MHAQFDAYFLGRLLRWPEATHALTPEEQLMRLNYLEHHQLGLDLNQPAQEREHHRSEAVRWLCLLWGSLHTRRP